MTNKHDDELPGATIGGAQEKFLAHQDETGRYIPVDEYGPLRLPRWKVEIRDPKPLQEFKNEDGPPSIVDTLLAKIRAANEEDLQRRRRGEITADEAVKAVLDRYSEIDDNQEFLAEMHQRALLRRQRFFDDGELVTAEELCNRLDISPSALEQAVLDHRMFSVSGPKGETWYPAFLADPYYANLEQISLELGDMPGEEKWAFFTTPKHSLGGDTPLVSLQLHNYGYVLKTAVEYRERSRGR